MMNERYEVRTVATLSTRVEEDGRLYRVAEYDSHVRVEVPINPDGTVKWFDDSKLLRDKKVL
jgi:hypothetical protein